MLIITYTIVFTQNIYCIKDKLVFRTDYSFLAKSLIEHDKAQCPPRARGLLTVCEVQQQWHRNKNEQWHCGISSGTCIKMKHAIRLRMHNGTTVMHHL